MALELCRLAQFPRVVAFSLLSSNAVLGNPRRLQPIQAVGAGRIEIAEGVTIGFFPSPYFFSTYAYIEARNTASSVSIGAGTHINNNFCAIAEHSSVVIGRDCLIGANVQIVESDFHGLKVEDRRVSLPEWVKPIAVGDECFIGSNVKIMKGVRIGNGSVIANGSIVTSDIPAGVVAGGVPARVIGAIM